MPTLPERASLAHLRKQAKDLLAAYRRGEHAAVERFRASLPASKGKTSEQVADLGLRLHDAQSCIAREYGSTSWAELKAHVESRTASRLPREEFELFWARLVFGREYDQPQPRRAVELLDARPELLDYDLTFACAAGDVGRVEAALDAEPGRINRPSGPFGLTPLLAAAHSSLIQIPGYAERLPRFARMLLGRGADLTATFRDPAFPDNPLGALYGAAGKNHNPDMTLVLLDAGADPNDNESLYHSVEAPEPTCTRMLFEAGARVSGTNALRHALDYDRLERLELLLEHGADPNEPGSLPPLHWAIRRGRSLAHVDALLRAGADPSPLGGHLTAYRLALVYGSTDVADRLRELVTEPPPSLVEGFLSACAAGDTGVARSLLTEAPDLVTNMSPIHLRLLPELAAIGRFEAVRTMLEIGWPVDVCGGDWNASALNLAVFNGDVALTTLLLAHGARWEVKHGFGGNVFGTLSHSSRNEPIPTADWVRCAEALIEAGAPLPDQQQEFSADVADYFETVRAARNQLALDA
jgi:ankyrin repeat protein